MLSNCVKYVQNMLKPSKYIYFAYFLSFYAHFMHVIYMKIYEYMLVWEVWFVKTHKCCQIVLNMLKMCQNLAKMYILHMFL